MTNTVATHSQLPRATTGISGLDDVLGGGFSPHRLYLVEGVPGSGKTTLALQFLLEGMRLGEQVLYITLSETAEELRSVAASHGWSLDDMPVYEMISADATAKVDEQYTMFHPSEVELNETTHSILREIERRRPSRVVFDSLSEIRLLAGSALRYRRQILAYKQFFVGRECTVLMLDDRTALQHDLQVQSIAHGVLLLDQLNPEFGADRRRMRVVKFRGSAFRGGFHDYAIRRGGLDVFPRLVAAEHRQPAGSDQLSTGIAPLDSLLGGGIDRGSSTLLVGASGTGKSTVAMSVAVAAAEQGLCTAMFIFEESMNTLLARADGLKIPLRGHLDAGRIRIMQIDPAEMSPGEFGQHIRSAVEQHKASVVVVDSLNGYLNSMPEERFLVIQLHELLTYLGQWGVATLLIGAHHGLLGGAMETPIDASYLADSVVMLRYFEAQGEVRQAISVVKKRGGAHERTIREFKMRPGGMWVGEPLRQFRGVLSGVPIYEGSASLGELSEA
jgi:circadian clock protein KaiC